MTRPFVLYGKIIGIWPLRWVWEQSEVSCMAQTPGHIHEQDLRPLTDPHRLRTGRADAVESRDTLT